MNRAPPADMGSRPRDEEGRTQLGDLERGNSSKHRGCAIFNAARTESKRRPRQTQTSPPQEHYACRQSRAKPKASPPPRLLLVRAMLSVAAAGTRLTATSTRDYAAEQQGGRSCSSGHR
eukprot:11201878-Alexandrium_andersonii.AAC.1